MGCAEKLAEEELAWSELMDAIALVPPERIAEEGLVPGWSTHDAVWHVAFWIARAAEVLERAAQGPPYPEEPDEESYYDVENDRAFATGREMSWESIQEYFAAGRMRARAAVEGCTDRDAEWVGDRLTEEIDHYREHASQIGAFAAASS